MTELLIIGAGPAGLALSRAYAGASRILEQSGEVGGLCRSIAFGGGVFDIGGHSFHSPHAEVIEHVETLMRGRWVRQQRDARVFFQGGLIPYPFQEHLTRIADPAVVAECLRERPAPGSPSRAANFEDWIVERFGAGVARHFMLPYNRKLWARDLKRMSCDWVGERIVGGEGDRSAGRRRPLAAATEVAYPAEGGFAEIYRAMAAQCGPIAFNRSVVRIDPKGRTAHTQDGEVFAWDHLVSTIPLPALVRTVDGAPAALIADADRLEYVSLKVLLILVAEPVDAQPQRVYVADPDVPAHKVAFNHTSSPSLRRRPVQAVMCEISHSPEKPLADERTLERAMIDWLAGARLIGDRQNVTETRWIEAAYGYPVYTDERAAIVERIRAWLAPLGIHTIGRFGGWDYVNSDACIWQGMELARALA